MQIEVGQPIRNGRGSTDIVATDDPLRLIWIVDLEELAVVTVLRGQAKSPKGCIAEQRLARDLASQAEEVNARIARHVADDRQQLVWQEAAVQVAEAGPPVGHVAQIHFRPLVKPVRGPVRDGGHVPLGGDDFKLRWSAQGRWGDARTGGAGTFAEKVQFQQD